MIWHSVDTDSVLTELEVTSENGLSNGTVDLRLKKYGKNVIRNIEKPSFKKHFLSQLKNKYVYILSVIAVISFIFSLIYQKNDYYSPILIIGIVLLNSVISAYQMLRSDIALNSLRSITNPIATVIRDGIEKQINAEDLVPGDIIIVKEGDYIPADARLIETNNFAANEFILSGEDVPANKKENAMVDDIADVTARTNMIFSGCVAVRGTAKAVVVETGLNTQIGHNSTLNQQSGSDSLPVGEKLDYFGRIINIAILLVCAVVFVLQLIYNFKNQGFATTTATALLNSMCLAVSAIPEGLPAISTIAVALGIERIIREDIIIKKVSALEILGKTTVICADKTGIITKNSMYLDRIFDGENVVSVEDSPLDEKGMTILRLASSCSTLDNDATEASIKKACVKHCDITAEELDNLFPRVEMIPFDSDRKTTTSINMIDGKPYAIIKGATESLADKFNNIDEKTVLKVNEEFAGDALRVVCIAIKPLDAIPSNPSPQDIENDLTFVGLIGLSDPLRVPTIDAIKMNDSAGIRTVMITGDNLTTAKAVARRAGILKDNFETITGAEIEKMTDEELKDNISKYAVFARVTPDDKLRIISAFRSTGEIVTITGDNFKDVQALASADIGCAMGRLGTDVIRANADIIIKNSHFDSIVNAIKESRGLFANIQKSVLYLLACNIAEILFYLISLIIFKKPPISAVQLLWINLLTDCAPVIAIATTKAEDLVMKKHPTALGGRLFETSSIIDIALHSVYISAVTTAAFIIGYKSNDYTYAMTMAFSTLALTEIFHAFNMRSQSSIFKIKCGINDFLFISSILIIFIILFLCLTPAGFVFGLKILSFKYLLISLLLSISIIVFCEFLKLLKKVKL